MVKTLDDDDLKILKKEFPNRWIDSIEKLAYPYEYFNCLDEYQKPLKKFKERRFL